MTSFLGRFRIITKILAIIALLATVAGIITAVGIQSLGGLNDHAITMQGVGHRLLASARMRQDVFVLNRAEYNIAGLPTDENLKAVKDEIATTTQSLIEKWDELLKTSKDPETLRLLEAAKPSWANYKNEIEGTLKTAAEVSKWDLNKPEEMAKARDRLQGELTASKPAAAKFNADIRAITTRLNALAEEVAAEAADAYRFASRLMIGVAAFGIIASLALGIFVAQFGITKPSNALVSVLQRMSKGEDVEVPGTERKDEVGQTANAVKAIRVMIEEKAAIDAAEKADRDLKEAAAKAERDRQAEEDRNRALTQVMQEFDHAVGGIAKAAMAGDFSQRVSLDGKDGVIRNLAQTMNVMCDNIGKVMDDLVAMMSALSEGDLTRRIRTNYEGQFGVLKDTANTTADRLAQTVSDIIVSAKEVTNAAAEISTATTDLSQRTEEQAASLEQTSASMEQISVTVKANADSAHKASSSALNTQNVAEHGGAVVAEAVQAMSRIEESSRRIFDIITVIDEISRQTNLLALNAAVEAARAGEAGRGFAVVATEVRSLAQRSSQAAKDIKDLITNSSAQVEEGVQLVNKAGVTLEEIVTSIKGVAKIVTDIADASAEQATGIEQVGKALTQMDKVTQQNSSLVEENAATAKTLEDQSIAMNNRVSFFKLAAGAEHMSQSQHAVRRPAAPSIVPSKAPPTAAASTARGNPVGRMQTALATAVKAEADWAEF